MPTFVERYTDEQRDAVGFAWNDRGIRPAARVAELARLGELTDEKGKKLEPFDMPEGTIRSVARHARKRRSGQLPSTLADLAPRDARENLRRRLVALTDHETRRLERRSRAKRDEPVDLDCLQKLAKTVAEISKIADPIGPYGSRSNGKAAAKGTERVASSPLARELVTAHRRGPSLSDSTPSTQGGEHGAAQQHEPRLDGQGDGGPGSRAGEQTAAP